MSTNKNILSLDKFYTNRDIVNLCYDVIKTHIDIDKNDLIIEPSAGNGSFINIIKNYLIIINFMILNLKIKK